MKIFKTTAETRDFLATCRKGSISVGFVPTMGALHEGHLALIRRAKAENGLVAGSVFVNPTQFNNKEDLAKYPRDLDADARLLEASGCDLLFAPEVAEMYPDGENNLLELDFGALGEVMEGRFRPGHFRGVATIVNRLFSVINPDRAYFGKKDYQQLAIIRELVRRVKPSPEIIGCETVREPDGLAMSSRNLRLTPYERSVAPRIFRVLSEMKARADAMDPVSLREWGLQELGKEPAFRTEYLEIAHRETLQPLKTVGNNSCAVVFAAVFLGDVRLIDNLELF